VKSLLPTALFVVLTVPAVSLPERARGQICFGPNCQRDVRQPWLSAADQAAVGHATALASIQRSQLDAAKAHLEAKSLFPNTMIRARRATAYASARQQRYDASKQQLYSAIAEFELQRERREFYAVQREQWRADGAYLPVVDLSRPLAWPSSLRGPEFAELRRTIELTAERWARTGSSSVASYNAIDDRDLLIALTAELTDQLKARIRTLPAQRYVEGRRFLDELALAARRPLPAAAGVTSQLAAK